MPIDNYFTDQRVLAGASANWYQTLNEDTMQALIQDPETEDLIWVSFEYEVCPLCAGKGSHVDPNIDCDGITGETFREDPDFYEDYRAGAYDVQCNQCRGKRVVATCTDERVIKIQEEEAQYQAMCAAERRMGA